MGTLARTVSDITKFNTFGYFKWYQSTNFHSCYILVFEYDGFSGEGPNNLFIEENLLQHRTTPLPRRRVEQKSLRLLHESKMQSEESKPEETDHVSRSQDDFIGIIGSETADVSADVQSDASDTFGPIEIPDITPPNVQGVTVGASEQPFHFTDPAATSSNAAATVTTATMRNTTQLSENAADPPASVTETSSQRSEHQGEDVPKSTAAQPSKPVPSPTTEPSATTPPATMTITTHVASTTAPTLTTAAPTRAPSTQAATTEVVEESESNSILASTAPPSTQRSITSLPLTTPVPTSPTTTTTTTTRTTTTTTPTTAATTAATTTTTTQAAQIKRTHRIRWEDEREVLDEPMQRQEESTSRKASELTS